MENKFRFYDWFELNWSRTTLPITAVLLLLSPLIFEKLGLLLFLVFLQLPAYMIHQYEEHAHGRFKDFVDNLLGNGALSIRDIFYINILAVWVVDIIALYLAYYIHIWFGLIAVYMPLFNGMTHIAATLKLRKYNPGVITSIFLFLPLGFFALYLLNQTAKVTILHNLIALGSVILIHVILIIRAKSNLNRIKNK